MKRTLTLLAGAAALILSAQADHAPGHKQLVNTTRDGLALQGYDPVAYFTDQKPVKGSPSYQTEHGGARYYFATAEHQRLFQSAPEKYVPAFGGYCGYAASIDRLSPISPEWFQILDGRLVLQHNQKAWDKWNADLPGNLKKADVHWPGLVERNGTRGRVLVNVDARGVALQGHDPVAYFTEQRAVRGRPEIEATYGGALYHFVSQAHREMFEKDPAKFVPQFGGFCGYAASIGKVRPVNPEIFQVIDGRLVLQHTAGALELWNRDVPGNLSRADANWPKLVDRKAGRKNVIDPRIRLAGLIPVY